MSASVTETNEQHGLKEHSHGAGAPIPVQTRSERPTGTSRDAFPALTGREAEWRYTPVAKLAALANGDLNGGQYPYSATLAEGVTASWVAATAVERGLAGLPEDRVAANAWEQTEQVLVIDIPAEATGESVIVRDNLGATARAGHILVRVGKHAEAAIVFESRGKALLAENVEFVLGDGAKLTAISVQEWDEDARHVAAHFATVGRDADLKHFVISLGGEVVRVNPSIALAGEGSGTDALGLYFSDAGQHLEQQVFVHHVAPHTRSRVNYKGALQGEGARSVWIGDVLIGQGATGTDSYEQNRNLVLSDGTRADSVPNLEIETGNIEGAGHASATGRFDDEQLFYLRARGIPEEEARRLVVHGFLAEILQQLDHGPLRERLEAAVEAELAAGVAR